MAVPGGRRAEVLALALARSRIRQHHAAVATGDAGARPSLPAPSQPAGPRRDDLLRAWRRKGLRRGNARLSLRLELSPVPAAARESVDPARHAVSRFRADGCLS